MNAENLIAELEYVKEKADEAHKMLRDRVRLPGPNQAFNQVMDDIRAIANNVSLMLHKLKTEQSE